MKNFVKGFMIMFFICFSALTLAGCGQDNAPKETEMNAESSTSGSTCEKLTPEQAKTLMDSETDYIILDVRTESEYAEGHIENAVLIPDNEIKTRAENELTDKDQLIFVYCRSGRRSKNAAQELCDLGYTNIKDFGGIIDWPYEIVK